MYPTLAEQQLAPSNSAIASTTRPPAVARVVPVSPARAEVAERNLSRAAFWQVLAYYLDAEADDGLSDGDWRSEPDAIDMELLEHCKLLEKDIVIGKTAERLTAGDAPPSQVHAAGLGPVLG
ncbi:hypothetical protein [Nannocystis punicea]|uniref:Uncharacterized protein n=1 Tax=Nannocystis punicea TaxID=2995304 RepID=A0ABY7GVM3_9BACT|nr:hypothetical protein [Nannocystis poenicansa]WAS90991.1 hypothetical protein O0S08_32785 [Nannocystis poenicansa]